MNRFECEAELTRRHASFARVEEARGVLAPVRLTGPLAGVSFHANLGEKDRATSPYEIYDCRLVLALEDFAHVLSREHIREVIHFSAYRPAVANAKRAIGFMGERHEGGLAVDIGALVRDDGTIVSIERDFHGGIGTSTCPNKVANKKSTAFWLRDLVCHEYDQGEFHVMLTPNYNWAHRNHFHFEVTSKAKWFYLR